MPVAHLKCSLLGSEVRFSLDTRTEPSRHHSQPQTRPCAQGRGGDEFASELAQVLQRTVPGSPSGKGEATAESSAIGCHNTEAGRQVLDSRTPRYCLALQAHLFPKHATRGNQALPATGAHTEQQLLCFMCQGLSTIVLLTLVSLHSWYC